MIRMLLTVVLPLIAPTLVYFSLVYLRAKWKKQGQTAARIPVYHNWPWFRLIGFGCVLLVMTFIVFGFPDYANFDGKYVPPHMRDGELIPGQFIPQTDDG